MAGKQVPGPMMGKQGVVATTEGKSTLYRQQVYRPGPVGRGSKPEPAQPTRTQVQAVMDSLAEELLVIEENEYRKMAVAWGAGAAVPIKDTLTDLYAAMKKLGLTGKAAIKETNGKQYVIIKGKVGVRKLLPGSRYVATNVKVADLVIGTKQLGQSALKSGALSLVFVAASDVIQAILDDKPLLTRELGFTLMADWSKSATASLAGFIAGAALSALGAPVVLPIAAGIIVGVAVGVTLDYHCPTDKIVAAMEESYQEYVIQPLYQIFREMLWRAWPHSQAPFPY